MNRYIGYCWKVLVLFLIIMWQFNSTGKAQNIVSGTVSDAQSGKTLPAVNVSVRGTTVGTSTDTEGQFSLDVPTLQDTLIFSFVGYQTQEIPIDGRTKIDISLQSQAILGEELVVVGYGTQQRSDLTGSVSSIGAEEVENVQVTSIDNALKGRVAGAYVKQTSAAPGGGTSVRIRGTNSLNAGSEPLYVIDGFPIYPDNSSSGTGGAGPPSNVLATLNINNIKSIEVLKDASATAIYGSRGASGVVMITTKRGQSGDTQVSYKGSQSFQTVANTIDMLSANEYARYRNLLAESQGGAPLYSEEEVNSLGEGTNWFDEITRTGMIADHELSISGGNEVNRFGIVTSLHNNKGILKGTEFKRYGLRLNLDNELFDDLVTLKNSWSYTRSESDDSETNTDGSLSGVINSSLGLSPIKDVWNEDGTYNIPLYIDRIRYNPLAQLKERVDNGLYNRFYGNSSATIDIWNDLSFTSMFGANIVSNNRNTFEPLETDIGFQENGVYSKAERSITNVLSENTISYSRQLTEAHSIDAVAGYTWQREINNFNSSQNRDFPTDDFENLKLGDGTNPQIPQSSRTEWTLQSFLARINYNFKDRYLATITFRRDGSSKFGENNKWANFPSLALGWRINNEPFFRNSKMGDTFSNLKIRASWGITGNSELPVYQSLSGLAATNYVFNSQLLGGLSENRIPNPNLSWEETTMYNVALDAGFLNGRLDFTFEYFNNQTEDLLLNVNIPSSTGFTTMLQNTGSMENRGFELSTDYLAISKNDLQLNISGNLSVVRNEITDLGGTEPFYAGGLGHLGVNGNWIAEGVSVGVWRGFDYIGIFQDDEEIQNNASRPADKPGYPRYRDVNGDGQITADGDQVIIGDPNPDFTWGFNTSLNYKQFDLGIFVRGVHGKEIRNVQQMELGDGIQINNQIGSMLKNSWRPDNQDATRPIIDSNREFANFFRESDFFIEDGTYIRVQNLTLGYTLPPEFTNKQYNPLRRARVYLSAQNLLTLTDYSGFDPEVSSGGQSNTNRGDDSNAYPRARVFTVGISLNF